MGLSAGAKGVMEVLPNMVSDSGTTMNVVQKSDWCLRVVASVTMCDGMDYV
jgi:hypothetical protein